MALLANPRGTEYVITKGTPLDIDRSQIQPKKLVTSVHVIIALPKQKQNKTPDPQKKGIPPSSPFVKRKVLKNNLPNKSAIKVGEG